MAPQLPDISILMPVKNTASFLTDCLDSIISQNKVEWELIAVDDGSTDNSLHLLNEYSQRDVRIKIFQNESSGIITALRAAYNKSSGKYITRMDSDDKMDEQKLRLMYEVLEQQGEGYIAVGLVEYFSDDEMGAGYLKYATWLNRLTSNNSNFTEIYKECSIPSPCWMIARSDFEKCAAFSPDIYPEDYDLAFRMRKAQFEICGINRVLHHWRDYSTRTSRTHEHYADNSFLDLKVMHFLDQDYNPNEELVVWGAGNKGKTLARLFNERDVDFRWICNNPNKIGQNIYGRILEEERAILEMSECSIIVSFVHEEAVSKNKAMFTQHDRHKLFFFC